MVRCLVLVAAILAVSTVVRAEETPSGHTAAEEKACRGDAHRFCKEDLADEFRTASCLQEHRDKISRACRAVLEGHSM